MWPKEDVEEIYGINEEYDKRPPKISRRMVNRDRTHGLTLGPSEENGRDETEESKGDKRFEI